MAPAMSSRASWSLLKRSKNSSTSARANSCPLLAREGVERPDVAAALGGFVVLAGGICAATAWDTQEIANATNKPKKTEIQRADLRRATEIRTALLRQTGIRGEDSIVCREYRKMSISRSLSAFGRMRDSASDSLCVRLHGFEVRRKEGTAVLAIIESGSSTGGQERR